MKKMSEHRRSLYELWEEWGDFKRLLMAAFWTWKTFLTPSHWRKELNEAEHVEKFCDIIRETMANIRPLQWDQLEEVARDKRNARSQSMHDYADNDED